MNTKITLKNLFALALMFATSLSICAQQLVYITENNKIGVIDDPSHPTQVTGPFNITGIAAGQVIEAIDYRPLTGELYALGYNASQMEAQLYVINQATAFATPAGASSSLTLVPGKIGFDFNPTVDKIRITSSNGANYRLHPVTGAIVGMDGNLAFAATDVNAVQTPGVIASAYTRSYVGSESTTLYNVDFYLNVLTTQAPPNDGVLNTVGSLNFGFHVSNPTVGFDFFYNGITGEETGYLSANTQTANDSLYTVNTSTGGLVNLGQIGNGLNVRDIAAVIKRNIPAIAGTEMYALTNGGNLISFDTDRPALIRSWKQITGITGGQTLLGIDFRPSTDVLYAFGYDRPFSQYQLYTLDLTTGIATPVNIQPIGVELDTAIAAFDFNPVADRIRVIGGNRENYRINPFDGTLAGVDPDITFAASDINAGQTPFVTSVAYTNTYPNAQSTTLFTYDVNLNVFANINPPNNGTLNSIGSSGLTAGGVALDAHFNLMNDENEIFCALNTTVSSLDQLYLVEGNMFSSIGEIGFGIPVKSISARTGLTPSNLSVTNLEAANGLSLYPNPATDVIQVTSNNMLGKNFRINDVTGRTILSGKIVSQDVEILDISIFNAGVYFFILEDGTTIKWVKK